MTNPSIESIVEALLFCSGRSLKPSEISEQSGHPESVIIESLSTLQNQYRRRRDSALTVVEVGAGGPWKSILGSQHIYRVNSVVISLTDFNEQRP